MHAFQRAESMFELRDFSKKKAKPAQYFSSTRKYQYIAAVSATMGGFGLGSALAWASPAIPSLELDTGKPFNFNSDGKRIMASIPTLGAFCSGALTGFLMTRLGRKTTLLLISAPFVFGWLLIAYAESLFMIVAGRIITGFCGGGFALAAPVFVSEVAEPCIRGKLVCIFQIMVTMGILFTYTFGAFLDWQWLSIISGLVPLVFLMLMLFMPESHVHHLWVGEKIEAEKALCVLRGATSTSDIEPELTDMVETVNEAKENPLSLRDMCNKDAMRTTILSLSLTVSQQLCGINGLIFYTHMIFSQAHVGVDAKVSAIIVAAVQVCGTVACAILIDSVGRRILLLISYIGMAITLSILGAFFYFNSSEHKPDFMGQIAWLPLVMFMAYIVSFSLGSGPVPWVIMSEIIPLRMKGFGCAIVTSSHWLFAFLVTFFFDQLQTAVGPAYCYWGFAVFCVLATIHVYLVIPETKLKTLNEIQRMFSKAETVNFMANRRPRRISD